MNTNTLTVEEQQALAQRRHAEYAKQQIEALAVKIVGELHWQQLLSLSNTLTRSDEMAAAIQVVQEVLTAALPDLAERVSFRRDDDPDDDPDDDDDLDDDDIMNSVVGELGDFLPPAERPAVKLPWE